MSLTVTFTGNSATLESNFFPPLHLEEKESWSCGLLNIEFYNSIPNVDETNNCLHIVDGFISIKDNEIADLQSLGHGSGVFLAGDIDGKNKNINLYITLNEDGKVKLKSTATVFNLFEGSILKDLGFDSSRQILDANKEHVADYPMSKFIINKKLFLGFIAQIPKGSYELKDISRVTAEYGMEVEEIRNELKCKVKCNKYMLILDNNRNSIGSLLGFKKFTVIKEGEEAISDDIVDIFKVNSIAVECSIVSGSWLNGKPSHILHMFYPQVAPGFKVVEVPQNVVYLDLLTNNIDTITLKLVDQEGRPVDFRGETITARIHLKRRG